MNQEVFIENTSMIFDPDSFSRQSLLLLGQSFREFLMIALPIDLLGQ